MRAAAIALALLASAPAGAVMPDEALPDPTLEERARDISAELRCVVCQNQSIDDSDAPLARDLRLLVRERIKAGDDDAAVKAYVVERYGSYVLLRPPFDGATAALWLGPFALLALAGVALARHLRRRAARPAAADARPLSAEEQADLDRLLGKR